MDLSAIMTALKKYKAVKELENLLSFCLQYTPKIGEYSKRRRYQWLLFYSSSRFRSRNTSSACLSGLTSV